MYTTIEATKIVGINRERLRDWTDRGYINPTIVSTGRGKKALFDKIALFKIALFKELVETGFKRSVAKELIQTMPNEPPIQNPTQIILNGLFRITIDADAIWRKIDEAL